MVHRTPFFLPLLYPSLIWRMPAVDNRLYLTFDDGPVSGPTEFVLETLSQFKVKATFFCIGENIVKYPGVFDKLGDHGHATGNHTYNHLNGWKTTTQEYLKNINRCENELTVSNDQFGSSRLFRPPYGRMKRRQIQSMAEYKIIMWDVLSMDYNKNLLPEKCLRNTIHATRSGSIIVFHDSYKAERNLTFTLPRLIEHFSSLGYTFERLEFKN
jgi:peptidoglycan/xylan/chitin deacetylase (PgdA/CDA1 family)